MNLKRTPLAKERHLEIAALLNDERMRNLVGDTSRAYGKSSQACKRAMKFLDAAHMLKAEMENMAYQDGHKGIEIYYPIHQ